MKTSQPELPLRLLSLISSNDFDWDGKCEFDEQGRVRSFRVQSIHNNYQMRPVPTSGEIVDIARSAKQSLSQALAPATRAEIAGAIKKLSLHFGMQARSADEVKHMFGDYCVDLNGYPLFLIDEACATLRTNGEVKFLPSSGELIGLMKPKLAKLKKIQQRVGMILGETPPAKQKPCSGMASLSDALDFFS